jgi:dGTPase
MEKFDTYNTGVDLTQITRLLDRRERENLSPMATLNSDGIRRTEERSLKTGYRQPFSVDSDRLLHSLAYTRYIDKTQVFYLIENDHITHRVLHVQLVSKIARTIGRFLQLNEDLIEAIALGHDIGHTPFGHDGEKILSELCQANGIGQFHHNVQSVQFLDKVERKGRGWNLCLQTLDGILCHDGEIHNMRLAPQQSKTYTDLENEIESKIRTDAALIPMTMEGCVVRMTDTIAYIGRDVEDAIRLGIIDRSDLPEQSVRMLGRTNGTIVFNLVSDIITNSADRPYIAFSPEVSDALHQLKLFNLERIYMNPTIKGHLKTIENLFEILFDQFLSDLRNGNRSSVVFRQFLKDMSSEYIDRHSHEEIVRDFIAGMTDQYFLRQCPESLRPKPLVR